MFVTPASGGQDRRITNVNPALVIARLRLFVDNVTACKHVIAFSIKQVRNNIGEIIWSWKDTGWGVGESQGLGLGHTEWC